MVLEGVATCAAGDLGEDGDRGGEGVGSEAVPELDQVRDVEPCTGALHTTSLRGWGMNKLVKVEIVCIENVCATARIFYTSAFGSVYKPQPLLHYTGTAHTVMF